MLVLASAGEVTVLEQDTHLMLSTGSTQEDWSRHDEKLLTGTLRIKPKMVRYFIYTSLTRAILCYVLEPDTLSSAKKYFLRGCKT